MPFKPMTIRVSETNSEVKHHPTSWVTPSANDTNHFAILPCCRKWRCFRTLPRTSRAWSPSTLRQRSMLTSLMLATLIRSYLRHFYCQIKEITEDFDDIWSALFQIFDKYWSKFFYACKIISSFSLAGNVSAIAVCIARFLPPPKQ